jgi:hypothetical protein
MCPVNHALNETGKFDRGALSASPLAMSFVGTGDVYYGNSRSAAGWMWGANTKAAMLAWMLDVEGHSEGWAHTTVYARLEDRGNSFPKVTKLYFPWGDTSAAAWSVAAGSTKSWTINYLAGYFSAGADASLVSL